MLSVVTLVEAAGVEPVRAVVSCTLGGQTVSAAAVCTVA